MAFGPRLRQVSAQVRILLDAPAQVTWCLLIRRGITTGRSGPANRSRSAAPARSAWLRTASSPRPHPAGLVQLALCLAGAFLVSAACISNFTDAAPIGRPAVLFAVRVPWILSMPRTASTLAARHGGRRRTHRRAGCLRIRRLRVRRIRRRRAPRRQKRPLGARVENHAGSGSLPYARRYPYNRPGAARRHGRSWRGAGRVGYRGRRLCAAAGQRAAGAQAARGCAFHRPPRAYRRGPPAGRVFLDVRRVRPSRDGAGGGCSSCCSPARAARLI